MPDMQRSLACGNITIHITNPADTVASIQENGFDMVLADKEYLPGEIPGVIAADFRLLPPSDAEPKRIVATVTYLKDNTGRAIGHLRDLIIKLENMHYDEDTVSGKSESSAEITLVTGNTALLEVDSVDDNVALVSMYIPVPENQGVRDDYVDLVDALELWGHIQDVISVDAPKGKHASGSDMPMTIVIEDYKSLLPDRMDYDVWQQLLLYEGWHAHMDSPQLPSLAHDDINVSSLRETFGILPDTVIAAALKNILKQKRDDRRAAKSIETPNEITHLDIYSELHRLTRSE